MENPIKMDDLGVPLFLETPIWTQKIHEIWILQTADCWGRIYWRGEVTSFDGSKMDGWGFSIRAEGANGANADLVPDREPDTEPWSFFFLKETHC